MGQKISQKFKRQWQIVILLHKHRLGRTIAQLRLEIKASRATLYRDFDELKTVGVPIQKNIMTGETRYSLDGMQLPPLHPTSLQLLAAKVARDFLIKQGADQIVGQLDELLAPVASRILPLLSTIGFAPSANQDTSSHLIIINKAIQLNRRIKFLYQSKEDTSPRERVVDPSLIYFAKQSPYLFGINVESKNVRTYKLARMNIIEILSTQVDKYPDINIEQELEHSIGVWVSQPIDVEVWIASHVSRFVNEWPLSAKSQVIKPQPDGSVIVSAKVAGTIEALIWIRSWGSNARVLSPNHLKDLVMQDLQNALSRYHQPDS